MGDVNVDGANRRSVQSVDEIAGRFTAEMMTLMGGRKDRLSGDPAEHGQPEHDVHAAFARDADRVLAGLLAVVMGVASPTVSVPRALALSIRRTNAARQNPPIWRFRLR